LKFFFEDNFEDVAYLGDRSRFKEKGGSGAN